LNDYGDSVRHDPTAVLNKESVTILREACEEVFLHQDLARYIVEIARASREDSQIKLGISPRGSMHLAVACKAFALVKGRRQVIAEDIQRLLPPVWNHRILPRHGRDNDSSNAHDILQTILEKIHVPR
jgi:MoxR-like ATPase